MKTISALAIIHHKIEHARKQNNDKFPQKSLIFITIIKLILLDFNSQHQPHFGLVSSEIDFQVQHLSGVET